LLAGIVVDGSEVEVGAGGGGKPRVGIQVDDGVALPVIVAQVERAVTESTLRKHGGNIAEAIRELGVSKSAWYRVRKA